MKVREIIFIHRCFSLKKLVGAAASSAHPAKRCGTDAMKKTSSGEVMAVSKQWWSLFQGRKRELVSGEKIKGGCEVLKNCLDLEINSVFSISRKKGNFLL